MHLSGIDGRAIPGPASGFERHTEETLVEIEIDPRLVCPDGMTGVVGIVVFLHYAENAPESVDYEVIGVFATHILEQTLACSPQSFVLVLFKGRHVALRGMENDPCRVKAQPRRLHP